MAIHHTGTYLKRYINCSSLHPPGPGNLLSVEFAVTTISYDPRFEAQVNKLKQGKLTAVKTQEDAARATPQAAVKAVPKRPRSSLEETGESIHHALKSYYDIALSRFVDVVCQQVIDHYLLHAEDGPLKVLSDRVALCMSADQLNSIAAEDQAVKEKREALIREIEALTRALQILRS